MAGGKAAVSFDEIIQADRARRRNEQLANDIFGRNKKNDKNDQDRNNRSSSRTPSLASRIGVQKRSSSSTSVNSRPQPPSRPSSTSLASRASRIQTALDSPTAPANISKSKGISIKGAAGPFAVVATNFAPGTTAADIESAVANDSTDSEGHNGLISCHLTSTHRDPAVTAELVYSERTVAERVVSLYNGQRADGRVLSLTIKSRPSRNPFNPTSQPTITPAQDNDDMDMTSSDPIPTDQYNSSRSEEEAARTRTNEHRRADPDLTDGRYGFSSSSRPNEPDTSPAQENGPRGDDDRDRDRDREREREQERSKSRSRDQDRDRDRDNRRYDDRDSRRHDDRRDSYRDGRDSRPYDNRPPYDAPRGGRPSHYGNGVGGPRGGFGGYGGPGRGGMYSDRMGPRGGFGPGRGFPRGGYGGVRGGGW